MPFIHTLSSLAFLLTAALAAATPDQTRRSGLPTTTSQPTATGSSLQACAASMNGNLPAQTPSSFHFNGNIRRYYVAAEEVEWNFAPTGWDNWLGVPLDVSPRVKAAGITKYGTKWLKALYRGYTDSSFSSYSPQPSWLGTQGPTIRAEVGDMIEVMFVNKLSKNYASMHSMGIAYSKMNEGSDYPNNTMPGQESPFTEGSAVPPVSKSVEPGACVVYKWLAVEKLGPAPESGVPSKVHSYHSFVSMYEDINAGLLGTTIIYAPGMMDSTIAQYREIPLLYMIYDESISWLGAENKARLDNSSSSKPSMPDIPNLSPGNHSIWYPQAVNILTGNSFSDAPQYHSMNGYSFANNPTYEMCQDDKVIWYVNSYLAESHVFHMHGNNFAYLGSGEYAVSLNNGIGKTLHMNATGVGLWQVICHVGDHFNMGMQSNYRVYPAGSCPLAPLSQG